MLMDTEAEGARCENKTCLLCSVCGVNGSKYTCPRCSVRTCSLLCCKKHKNSTGCCGKRDVAAFVARKNYNYFSFLSDYRFLESIDRDNENREKNIFEIRNAQKNRQRNQSKLIHAIRSLRIDYRPSASALLARAKLNRTHIVCAASPQIAWTVELCLLDPENPPSLSTTQPWRRSDLNLLHLVIHDCSCESLLSEIWREKVAELSTEEQESLAAPTLATTPQPSSVSPISSWILRLNENSRPFFYIQCLDKVTKTWFNYEVFADSTRLLDILQRSHFVVHEFPTIWVSLKELSTC